MAIEKIRRASIMAAALFAVAFGQRWGFEYIVSRHRRRKTLRERRAKAA
jgi:hypothetical protein